MKIELRAEHATDERSTKAATGKSMGEWFALLDALGGPSMGRRAWGSWVGRVIPSGVTRRFAGEEDGGDVGLRCACADLRY